MKISTQHLPGPSLARNTKCAPGLPVCVGNGHDSLRGTVLLPAVVAMIVLLACGMSLAESFAVNRSRSTLGQLDERSEFIAEAGLWHAAFEEDSIVNPVPFGGGSYTVTRSGDEYISTAVLGENVRTIGGEFTGAGGSSNSPLDEEASLLTVGSAFSNTFEIDLISVAPAGVLISSFSLTGDHQGSGDPRFIGARIDETVVVLTIPTLASPILGQEFNRAGPLNWTVQTGGSPTFQAVFTPVPVGSTDFVLTFEFSNGGSSTFEFTVDW